MKKKINFKIVFLFLLVFFIFSITTLCSYATEFLDVSSKDNINLLSEYENVSDTNLSIVGEEVKKEYEDQGVASGTYSVNSKKETTIFTKQNIVFSTIIAICDAIVFYFIYKVIAYFVENSRYKKAIAEGKNVEKPKVKIKLKYIVLLILLLDLVIWSGIFIINI